MPEGKTIWFLVSTVALCNQQCEVLRTQIPAASIKILTSDDGVDSWSTREIWDAALADVRIVTAPYQILFDALSHGFVQLESLALIVFDEGMPSCSWDPLRFENTDRYVLLF